MSVVLAQENGIISIFFRFDPKVISLIKQIPNRAYVESFKYWTIPLTELDALTSLFRQNQISFNFQSTPVDLSEFRPKNVKLIMEEAIFKIDKPSERVLEEFKHYVNKDMPGVLQFNYAELLFVLRTLKNLGLKIFL